MTKQATAHHPGAQTIARAIGILKCFTDAQPQLSLAEIVEATRLNKATAHRMLAALEREGLIARPGDGEAYRLGSEAIALGGRALRATTLHAASHPELETLAQVTGESATIEALIGDTMFILDEAISARLLGAMPSIGTRWAVHATSTGKAVLAHLGAAELERLLEQPLARFTPHTIASAAELKQEIAAVRRLGYATVCDELEVGYAAVAAPIFDHQGRVVAAICIGGPTVRLSPARLAELSSAVKQAAARSSGRLGYREIEPRTKNRVPSG
jgi:IclR family transcriptional regulator, acetate operon repressor